METPDDPPSPRIPESGDLVALCRALNTREARYVVIGGLAMAHQGLIRATEDVDLLIEHAEIQGVRIPFASKKLLWRLKQGWREKDQLDRHWLEGELGGPPKD